MDRVFTWCAGRIAWFAGKPVAFAAAACISAWLGFTALAVTPEVSRLISAGLIAPTTSPRIAVNIPLRPDL
jgi:hypothetical protein